MMMFALEFNAKGLLLLIAAVVCGIVAVVLLLPSPRPEWPRGLLAAAWCLGFIAWFIWAAGG
jgi:hypothetical protein